MHVTYVCMYVYNVCTRWVKSRYTVYSIYYILCTYFWPTLYMHVGMYVCNLCVCMYVCMYVMYVYARRHVCM
jgi:hypothetical protein